MIEWLAFPAALAIAATIPKRSQNDKKKIDTIFKNTGYGVKKVKGEEVSLQTPKYKRKQPIYDGVNIFTAKFESECTNCGNTIKRGDVACKENGVTAHIKCFKPCDGQQIGTTYSYSIPLGLPATKMAKLEKDIRVFTDGLQKPVEVDFKRTLNIHVYDEELPNMFPYAELPAKSGTWEFPLGRSVRGLVWHNFDHVPHMTVAGTTRFGKTVLLRMMMTYLIEQHPDDVEFYIIDLKGGLEFGRYENLRQVRGVAADPSEAAQMLQGIHEQVQEDYAFFRKNYYANVVDTPIRKRRFIIVDEAAQLAPEKWMKPKMKELLGMCQFFLGEIARVAGALGYREVFCTQYPTADTLPRSIKQNADAKVSFRLPSGYASGVAIDEYGAEELPSDVKGRALFKTHELKELQVPFISHDEMWERLERYQVPQLREGEAENVIGTQYEQRTDSERAETPAPGENTIEFGEAEIRY